MVAFLDLDLWKNVGKMFTLRLNEHECAATVIQAYFRRYTVCCLRFAPDYDQQVSYRIFTYVDADTDSLLSDETDEIYFWISI